VSYPVPEFFKWQSGEIIALLRALHNARAREKERKEKRRCPQKRTKERKRIPNDNKASEKPPSKDDDEARQRMRSLQAS